MRQKKTAKLYKKLISLLKTKISFRDPNPDPDSEGQNQSSGFDAKISCDRHRTQIRIRIRRPKSVVGIRRRPASKLYLKVQ